jgi:hypothetical protein
MNNGVFVGFSRIFLVGILIFKGLTARRLYKSFGVKGLIRLLAEGRDVAVLLRAQIDSEEYIAYTSMSTFGTDPGLKRQRSKFDHSPTSSDDVKIKYNCIITPIMPLWSTYGQLDLHFKCLK